MTIRSFLLGSALLPLGVLAVGGDAAHAAGCAPALISDGAVITCSADSDAGVNQSLQDGGEYDEVSLTVQAGVTLDQASSGEHTVDLQDDAVIDNQGTILNSAGKDAIHVDDGAEITNSGTISGDDEAIQADKSLTVVNSGLIEGADEGIEAGDGASITNTTSGVITGVDDAINVAEDASITNEGLIANIASAEDEPQDAIDIDSGTITNSGTISSTYDAAIDFDATDDEMAGVAGASSFGDSLVTNSGTIIGTEGIITDPAANSVQVIVNSGTITGTSGVAIDLYGGDDALVLLAGSEINGSSFFGSGDDSLTIALSGAMVSGLFDGGTGTDTVSFTEELFADIIGYSLIDEVLSLSFADGLSLSLAGWEIFLFADAQSYSLSALTAALAEALPAVPLPAPLLLLGSGLFGLGALARRRRVA